MVEFVICPWVLEGKCSGMSKVKTDNLCHHALLHQLMPECTNFCSDDNQTPPCVPARPPEGVSVKQYNNALRLKYRVESAAGWQKGG